MKKSINILITSSGRRVELVKCFKNARDRLGFGGQVMVADASEDAPTIAFADKAFRLPRLNSPDYLLVLIDLISQQNIDLVVPTIDTELLLLAENKKLIESRTKAKVLISNIEAIKICRDKIATAKFFENNNFGVPHTLTQQDLISKNYDFPLFIKPKDGSSSVNAFLIKNEKELEFFSQYVKEHIIQTCITGVEYTVDVFLDFESNIISCVPRKRLAVRGGEVLKGLIDLNKIIIEDVTRLMNILKPIGHITVQGFLGEDNVFRYIEINPRFGGGAPMSIKAGADSCEFLYRLLAGEKIDLSSIKVLDKAMFSRFDDSVMLWSGYCD